ncbi:MAG TPA: tandem-95 repeat protein, partial [Methanobacterium sp.]|nr:tandem-95 repeat protein [Methanobacterium sp.]
TTLSGCTFTNTAAYGNGGAIFNCGTITTLSGCNFINNKADLGGAIYNFYGNITSLSGCIFTGNTASLGGAIANIGVITGLSGCTFTNNTAESVYYGQIIGAGGAIYNEGSLTANYNRFYNNTSPSGNAIYCEYGSVDANYNWWSSNLDPKTISNLIYVANGGSVNTTLWVILSVNATPTTIYKTQTSTVTADLNHYMDSNGNIGALRDYIPDVPVTFAVDANGNLDSLSGIISNGQNATTNFTATQIGSATVNATVDGFTVNQLITIMNRAPVAQNDSKTIDEDTTATGQITATDADGDTLTYTKYISPAHGSVTVNNNGTWTYTPEANYNGLDNFKVLVSDSNGGTAVSTVFITVNSVNDIPVAQNDTATTKEDKSINISVLGNDSDVDGDSLTVTNVTQPNHGAATINADGTVIYTPNSNWYGLDSFTYTVSDGNGGIATATVNITVNQAVSDLYIKTTISNLNPTTGETFTLTYKLGNYGPDEAKNVTITFQIPKGLDFVNIKVDKGKCTYNETTRTVTWTLDSVPVGDPYLYLTVKAADGGTYKITPSTTSATYNMNSGNSGIIIINVQPNNSNSNSGNTVNAASKTTIGLQKTGLPLNYLILAVLMVLSGLVVPKRK